MVEYRPRSNSLAWLSHSLSPCSVTRYHFLTFTLFLSISISLCCVVDGSLLGSPAARQEVEDLIQSHLDKTYGESVVSLFGGN